MQKNLSKDQVQAIIDNAPKDVKTEDIIKGLVNRGFTLEGLNDQQPQDESFVTKVGNSLGDRVKQIGEGIDKITGTIGIVTGKQIGRAHV